jgi:hypothetical protein
MEGRKPVAERAWPLWLALAAAVAFRWPAIEHATETNSDAAVVGLQAMHFLRGELSPLLWGSGYQTSVDSAFAALVFGLFGPSARALVTSSLALHLVLMSFAWSTLARRLDPIRAALALVPLVYTSSPLQTYILYPPRQASLTIAVAAVWALDRAADSRAVRAFAVGGFMLALACFADPYALVLVPPVLAFGLACAIDPADRAGSRGRLVGLALGLGLGAVPFAMLRASARATSGQLVLSGATIAHNARLLGDALAWTVGARAWATSGAASYSPWAGPPAVRGLVAVGGTLLFALVLAGGAAVFLKRIPWTVRRLGVVGGLAVPVTIGGYLLSPMVMDLFSARYLAAIPLLAPFALAPLAWLLGARKLAPLVATCAVASGVAGWVGYGPFLRATHGGPNDDAAIEHALEALGVRYAVADYWTAYRLTFLTNEALVVVPVNEAEDRYPPYRQMVDAAPVVAYLYDPQRSREDPTWMEQRVESGQTPYQRDFAIVHAGRYRALVLRR